MNLAEQQQVEEYISTLETISGILRDAQIKASGLTDSLPLDVGNEAQGCIDAVGDFIKEIDSLQVELDESMPPEEPNWSH